MAPYAAVTVEHGHKQIELLWQVNMIHSRCTIKETNSFLVSYYCGILTGYDLPALPIGFSATIYGIENQFHHLKASAYYETESFFIGKTVLGAKFLLDHME